jgi:hypothetical protein
LAVADGFHTTVLPIRAGAHGRLAAMAVKLRRNLRAAGSRAGSRRRTRRSAAPRAKHEVDVEAEEIDKFDGRINLGLMDRLGLADAGLH